MTHLLEVAKLGVTFRGPSGPLPAVEEISFSLDKGETLALVGTISSSAPLATGRATEPSQCEQLKRTSSSAISAATASKSLSHCGHSIRITVGGLSWDAD